MARYVKNGVVYDSATNKPVNDAGIGQSTPSSSATKSTSTADKVILNRDNTEIKNKSRAEYSSIDYETNKKSQATPSTPSKPTNTTPKTTETKTKTVLPKDYSYDKRENKKGDGTIQVENTTDAGPQEEQPMSPSNDNKEDREGFENALQNRVNLGQKLSQEDFNDLARYYGVTFDSQRAQTFLEGYNKRAGFVGSYGLQSPRSIARQIFEGKVSKADVIAGLQIVNPSKIQEVEKQLNDFEIVAKGNAIVSGSKGVNPLIEVDDDQSLNGIYQTFQKAMVGIQDYLDTELKDQKSFMEVYNEFMDSDRLNELDGKISKDSKKYKELEDELENLDKNIRDQYGNSISKNAMRLLLNDQQEPIINEMNTLADSIQISQQEKQSLRETALQQFSIYQLDRAEYTQRVYEKSQFAQQMTIQEFQTKKENFMSNQQRQEQLEDRAFEVSMKEYFDQMGFQRQLSLMTVQEDLRLSSLEKQMELERQGGKPQAFTNEDGSVTIVDLYNPENIKVIPYQGSYTTPSSSPSIPNSPIPSSGYGGNSYFSNFSGITGGGGEHDQWRGIDLDGQMGDPIPSSVEGEVVQVVTGQGKSSKPSYGNFVDVKDKNGNIHRFAHLSDATVQVGTKVSAGQVIGKMGNSGYTIAGKGGDGSHLDYSIQKADGSRYQSSEIGGYLDSLAGMDQLSPVAKMVIDGEIKVNEIKDQYPNDERWRVEEDMRKISEYRASNNILDAETQNLIDIAGELRDVGRLGRIAPGTPLAFKYTDARGREAKLEQLKSALSLENLIEMKSRGATFGALTDREMGMISSAVTSLDRGLPQDQWEAELSRIIAMLGGESPEQAEAQLQTNTYTTGEVVTDFSNWGQSNAFTYSNTIE